MLFGPDDVAGVERIIQSAVAPAFLLSSIFSALSVLAGRLGRLIDRERAIREGRAAALAGERGRRACCVHRAIFGCVMAAILLCTLIVWSFIGGVLGLPVAWVMAALMIGAMVALITALLFFLSEVRLAAHHLPLDDNAEARPTA